MTTTINPASSRRIRPRTLLFLVPLVLSLTNQAYDCQAQGGAMNPPQARRPERSQPGQPSRRQAPPDGAFNPAQSPAAPFPGMAMAQHGRRPALLADAKFRITLGKPFCPLRHLLGINAGPTPSGEPGNADLTPQYRWAGIRQVRTQDYYGPLDLSVMYPDLTKDPLKPDAYRFTESDRVFSAIVNARLEPYLRLGDSYNNVRIPKSQQQADHYARAAVQVVRHFKLGEMNGFKSDFSYVEIGNEPDNHKFWPAAFEEFLPVFVNIFQELKRIDPALKVGGPGFVVSSYKVPVKRYNVTRFLTYMKDHGVTPDFLSFHLYSNDPGEYYDMVQFYRQAAEKHGMAAAELHVSEWNTEKAGLELRTGRQAAPFVTACWIALQQAGADVSCLFRGTDTNIDNPGFYGIFRADGTKKPAAHAFQLWSRLAAFSQRLEVSTGNALLDAVSPPGADLKPVWLLAAGDDQDNAGLLIANIGEQALTYELAAPHSEREITITDYSDPNREPANLKPGVVKSIILKPMSIQFVRIPAVSPTFSTQSVWNEKGQ